MNETKGKQRDSSANNDDNEASDSEEDDQEENQSRMDPWVVMATKTWVVTDTENGSLGSHDSTVNWRSFKTSHEAIVWTQIQTQKSFSTPYFVPTHQTRLKRQGFQPGIEAKHEAGKAKIRIRPGKTTCRRKSYGKWYDDTLHTN